jgi:hypothetical protein
MSFLQPKLTAKRSREAPHMRIHSLLCVFRYANQAKAKNIVNAATTYEQCKALRAAPERLLRKQPESPNPVKVVPQIWEECNEAVHHLKLPTRWHHHRRWVSIACGTQTSSRVMGVDVARAL